MFFSSCTSKQSTTVEPNVPLAAHQCPEPIIVHDTVVFRDTIVVEVVSKSYDSLLAVIKKKNDSLFLERFRLERVKYYNNIVKKNKSQLKFLSGWISRAVQ